MSDMPKCRYCHQPYTIARETEDFWEMACETCKVGHVFSKPRAKAAARYLSNIEAEATKARMIKAWESRHKEYSIPSPTKTSEGVN